MRNKGRQRRVSYVEKDLLHSHKTGKTATRINFLPQQRQLKHRRAFATRNRRRVSPSGCLLPEASQGVTWPTPGTSRVIKL